MRDPRRQRWLHFSRPQDYHEQQIKARANLSKEKCLAHFCKVLCPMANPWPPVHLLTCPYSLALPLNHVTGGFGLMCVAPEGKEKKELRGPGGNHWLPACGAGAFLQPWGWIKACVHPGPLPRPAAYCSPRLRAPPCGSGQAVCRGLALQEQSLGSPSVLPSACPSCPQPSLCCPCSGLDIDPVTGGTFPAPSSLCPQDQAAPVAPPGRAGIWHGRSVAAHGARRVRASQQHLPWPPQQAAGHGGQEGPAGAAWPPGGVWARIN